MNRWELEGVEGFESATNYQKKTRQQKGLVRPKFTRVAQTVSSPPVIPLTMREVIERIALKIRREEIAD